MFQWKCSKCGRAVKSERKPNNRYEPVVTVVIAKNISEGVINQNTQSSASHYGPVCFGSDRGEDYFSHDWNKVG